MNQQGHRRGWRQGRGRARSHAAIPGCAGAGGSASEQGYLLPLACGGSLLLLLSCLSLQSLIWGRQLDGRGAWQQRRADDRFGAAAQSLALAFNDSHQCLLALPSSVWPRDTAMPAGCTAPIDPAPLWLLPQQGGPVRLVSWTPPPQGSALALDAAAGELTLAEAQPQGSVALQRRFRLLLAGEPPRVSGVQELDR